MRAASASAGPHGGKVAFPDVAPFPTLKWICTFFLLLAFEGPGKEEGVLVTVGRLGVEKSLFSLLGDGESCHQP